MKPLIVFLSVAITGIPVAYIAIKYFKLRYEYFKEKEKNDFFLLKKTFTPMSITSLENDEKVKKINKLTSILWISMILYGVIMILIGRHFLYE